MFSGITGKVFQSVTSGSAVGATEVFVGVPVGTGVIGEYFLGFCVAVGKSSVGNDCVAPLTGITTDSAAALPLQAVIKTLTIKARNNKRFTRAKYSGEKLISDEFLCYRVPHTYSFVTKLEVKM